MCERNPVEVNVPKEGQQESHVEDSAKKAIAIALTSTEKLIEGYLILHFILAYENVYIHSLTSSFSSLDRKANEIQSLVPQTAFYNLSLINHSF
jgi:hypothetical protein